MRLEPLFSMSVRYTHRTYIGPIAGRDGSEGILWALREGAVDGDRIRGTYRACNHPRRRTDDVNVPDVHGVITTDDGADVYFELHGLGVPEPGQPGRRVTGSATYRTAAPRYSWLNTVVSAVEGLYKQEPDGTLVGDFRVYECVNEVV